MDEAVVVELTAEGFEVGCFEVRGEDFAGEVVDAVEFEAALWKNERSDELV